MSEDEPLAFIFEVSQAPDLFVDGATEALGHSLDPDEFYIAMRWDYDEISKVDLLRTICLVRSPVTGKSFWARPADWGPHEDTGSHLRHLAGPDGGAGRDDRRRT